MRSTVATALHVDTSVIKAAYIYHIYCKKDQAKPEHLSIFMNKPLFFCRPWYLTSRYLYQHSGEAFTTDYFTIIPITVNPTELAILVCRIPQKGQKSYYYKKEGAAQPLAQPFPNHYKSQQKTPLFRRDHRLQTSKSQPQPQKKIFQAPQKASPIPLPCHSKLNHLLPGKYPYMTGFWQRRPPQAARTALQARRTLPQQPEAAPPSSGRFCSPSGLPSAISSSVEAPEATHTWSNYSLPPLTAFKATFFPLHNTKSNLNILLAFSSKFSVPRSCARQGASCAFLWGRGTCRHSLTSSLWGWFPLHPLSRERLIFSILPCALRVPGWEMGSNAKTCFSTAEPAATA